MRQLVQDHSAKVFLRGDFDLSRGSEIIDSITAALDDIGSDHSLVVDMADVTFFDCYSLSQLVQGWRRAAGDGVAVSVVHVDGPATRRVFEIAATDPTVRALRT